MAAAIVLAERERRGLHGTVAIHAASAAEVKGTVEALLPRVRYILLGPMRGRETLIRELLYEKGAVLSAAAEEELASAETLLLFTQASAFVPENALYLPLFGDAEPRLALRDDLEEQVPAAVPRLPLLAALFRSGAIKCEDIFPL